MNKTAQSTLALLGGFIVFGIVYFGYFAKVAQDFFTALANNGSTTGLWNFVIANGNLWILIAYVIAVIAIARSGF